MCGSKNYPICGRSHGFLGHFSLAIIPCAALVFALALSITRTDRCAKLSLHGGSGMAVATLSCSFVCIHARAWSRALRNSTQNSHSSLVRSGHQTGHCGHSEFGMMPISCIFPNIIGHVLLYRAVTFSRFLSGLSLCRYQRSFIRAACPRFCWGYHFEQKPVLVRN